MIAHAHASQSVVVDYTYAKVSCEQVRTELQSTDMYRCILYNAKVLRIPAYACMQFVWARAVRNITVAKDTYMSH